MSTPAVRRRTGGRSARVREAVLKATLGAVVEHGFTAVNISAIAREADVHETSIYRRWPTKERLILDALLDYSEASIPISDTGSLRGDLVSFARDVTAYLQSPLGRALSTLMATTEDDDALAAAREQFWSSRLALSRAIIDRAKDRGEAPTDLDTATAMELLVAPLHFRVLLTRRRLDDQDIDTMVDALLGGLRS